MVGRVNAVVDGYRVLGPLGEGGMAVVYLAEQLAPVRREVALKILKPGMDSVQVLARFEGERQALARLEHPHIAKIYDAGATHDGRPFFAMERVHGLPITRYCVERGLDLHARLRLFVEVCGAVQHAHQRGIIHRDLKPSNVLVEDHDGRGVPKIIDFGIAKSTGGEAPDGADLTRVGQLIGTPQYMSPEQATLAAADVDTRTDVYSLGATLYELLTGAVPIELDGIADYAVGIALREREPPPPSQRVTGDARRALRGDLDRIVLKALEKERDARYPTVNALATDLDLYLRQLPILARPPSAGYVIGRYVRRNRVIVAAAAVATLALVGGLAAATTGLLRARDAERQALADAASARELASFMVELFEVSDPGEARGNAITAREILDRAAGTIDARLDAAPAARATMLATIAEVYGKLGLYSAGLPLAQSALAARRAAAAAAPTPAARLELAASLDQVGNLYTFLARPDDAEPAHREALALLRASEPADPAAIAMTLQRIGVAEYTRGRFDDALALFEEAKALLDATPDASRPQRASLVKYIANQHHEKGAFEPAIANYREALELFRLEYGADHPDIAAASGDLAVALKDSGRRAEAEPAYRESLAVFRRTLGPRHPDVANVLSNMAVFYMDGGDFAAALAHAQEATNVYREVLGDDHRQTNIARLNAARAQVQLGNPTLAERELRAILDIRRRTL